MRLFCPTSRTRFRWGIAPFDGMCVIVAPFIAVLLRDPNLFKDNVFPAYMYIMVTIFRSLSVIIAFRLSDGLSRFSFSARSLGFDRSLAGFHCSEQHGAISHRPS